MDVDKIQKINSLALELMRQGLASDREDAVKQAEMILSKKDYTNLKETMHEEKEEIKSELGYDSNRLHEIMEKNNAFIVQKIKSFQEQMDSLKKEVENLRGSMTTMNRKVSGFGENSAPRTESSSSSSSSTPNKQTEIRDHPRVGNFTSGEVSIEKFFYAGRK